MVQRKFREVEQNFIKLEKEGDSIEGILVEKGSVSFNNGGVVGRYRLEDDDGHLKTVMGSTTIDDLLDPVPTGTYLRITYTGNTRSNSGRQVKQYKLEVAEE